MLLIKMQSILSCVQHHKRIVVTWEDRCEFILLIKGTKWTKKDIFTHLLFSASYYRKEVSLRGALRSIFS